MPFPLAHPAAVLPLRRLCPRRFNFPALVIGSLCPDIGYCFGPLHLEKFSHRWLDGSVGFCLPAGLLLLLAFYSLRRPVVQRLSARHRRILEPLCLRPAGLPLVMFFSVLVGAWTHDFLDSTMHENGWFVRQLPFLQASLTVGNGRIEVCELLYSLATFAGIICIALTYLNWLERVAGTPGWAMPGFKWGATLLFAGLTLLLSLANHEVSSPFSLAVIVVLAVLLAALFFTVAGWALRDPPAHELGRRAKPAAGGAGVTAGGVN